MLGSSLNVTPASYLPYSTAAVTVVVTRGEVMLEKSGRRYFVDADLDDYFQEVADALGRHRSSRFLDTMNAGGQPL